MLTMMWHVILLGLLAEPTAAPGYCTGEFQTIDSRQ